MSEDNSIKDHVAQHAGGIFKAVAEYISHRIGRILKAAERARQGNMISVGKIMARELPEQEMVEETHHLIDKLKKQSHGYHVAKLKSSEASNDSHVERIKERPARTAVR